MNRKISRTNRNYIIIGLCMILVIMGVGYAAFQSQLKITGTSNIASNFLVKITDIQSSVQSGSATNAVEPSYTDTTATFKTNLVSPGDSMKYDITVSNEGSIDAVLESIEVNTGENDAITFETSGIENGDKLEASQTDILTVIVSYNSSVTSQPENTNSTITVTLNYKQDDGTVVPPTPAGPTIGGQDVELVESGDGLYEDEYEEGRYVYRGSNPNNYITFNNETWRIIAKETDGTYKILRNELLPNRSFDSKGARTTGYCSQGSAPSSGCNAWSSTANMVGSPAEFTNGTYKGSVDKDSEMLTYLNGEYLSSITTDADKIVNHTWSIGAVTYDNSDLAGQINGEKAYQWNGKVGLISHSGANSNQSMCGTAKINNENYETCRDLDWMYISGEWWWSLSPYAVYAYNVFGVYGDGGVYYSSANNSIGVRPAIYLSSDISLSGNGTLSDPYRIN